MNKSITLSNPTPRLAVLLLAAGEGARLGSYPKALLKKDGQSLIKRFCLAVAELSPVQIVIVTGFHADLIEAEIQELQKKTSLPISIIRNLAAKQGQVSSVRLGLESLHGEYDLVLVALSDQPGIGVAELQALFNAYLQRKSGKQVILPLVNGQRGNPVLFSSTVIKDILAMPGMVCRPYLDQHPELIERMTTDLQGYVLDVDTLEDIVRENLTLG
jgi:CTP:molybdopterin cytidylyltransferase MocA